MKKIFLLFLLFSFSFLNAQKYLFTTFVKYSGHSSNSNRESIIFTNSNSDSYYLLLLKFESSFTANLYDYENRKMHKFIVTESETKGNTSFKFDYQNTTNFFVPNNYEFSKYAYDFQTLELNDSIRKVKFTIYKNSRKKKIIRNYDLVVKKYDTNLFSAFRISCLHPFESLEKLNIFENVIVVNARTTFSEREIEIKLEEFKKVNFELDIPKSK